MARITQLFLIVTIALAFLMRIHLAITRGFDPDEFSYLHWAWLVARGYLPYRDFFFYITPVFPWLLTPILWLTGDSINFLIASRIGIVLGYCLSAAFVYRLSRGSLLSSLIFLTFPMTLDKTIDIRPDMVMLILYFASVLVRNPFLSGVLFGVSFLLLPKIIFLLPALLYLRRASLHTWFFGAGIIGLGFFGYLWVNNLVPIAYTSITKDSLAVTANKSAFSPFLLLSPYPLIYLTRGGPSVPWAVNTALWILGVIGLLKLLTTNRVWGIFWSVYIAGSVLFIALFPSPYVQYFLPLSIAASILVFSFRNAFFSILISLVLLASFFLQYRERVATTSTNREQLQVIRDVLSVTKPTETIYDMVGSFVFRPDGFFICCHPYGEFVHRLASRPGLERGLRESLILRQTKFLVMDQVGFVFWQTPTPDLTFLRANYLPMKYPKLYSLGVQFRCQNGACMPTAATRSTNVFTILVQEKYTVTLEPHSASVAIDGKEMRNGQMFDFATGLHRFLASPATNSLRIQLDR